MISTTHQLPYIEMYVIFENIGQISNKFKSIYSAYTYWNILVNMVNDISFILKFN